MQFGGEYEVAMERTVLWERLHDMSVLAACLPGCESLERQEDGSLKAIIVSKLGPIRARFVSRLQIEDLEAFHRYRLTGTGDSGQTGSAKGEATISLRDGTAATTMLSYDAKVAVTGRLAQIGGRLLQGTAESFAADFFAKLVSTAAPTAAVVPIERAPLFARRTVRVGALLALLLVLLLLAYLATSQQPVP